MDHYPHQAYGALHDGRIETREYQGRATVDTLPRGSGALLHHKRTASGWLAAHIIILHITNIPSLSQQQQRLLTLAHARGRAYGNTNGQWLTKYIDWIDLGWLNVELRSAGPGQEHLHCLLELVNQIHFNLYNITVQT